MMVGIRHSASQRDLHVPHTSGVINRPRLLSRLQAASEHKLTLICAPPGYGKTTIAAQFAYQSKVPVAWHTVEERERDIPNLYTQCLAALESIAPGIQKLTPVPGYTPGELAALIADYLREHVSRKVIYILDDLHLLAGSPAAELWLYNLVALLPPTCHLILVSRILPNLPLTEMIARGEVVALGQEYLRFTSEEVSLLAEEALGTAPAENEINDLVTRLEGWPAGIVLAIHPLPVDLERAMLSGGKGPEALFNALASTMLDIQPPGLADFLLQSSTLIRMTPELCTTVLGLSESTYWLTEIQNRNLFVSRIPGGLTYHKLFRDFLQQRLKTDDPQGYAGLHARAALWFEENDRVDESFDHYMAAGLVERAAAVAERVSQAYFAQGKVETLLKWRGQLGAIGLFAPSLLYNCSRVHTDRYDYQAAATCLDESERGFQLNKDRSGAASVLLQRAMINLQQGEYRAASLQAAQIAESGPSAPNLRGRALKILGVAALRLGEAKASVRYLEDSLQLHRVDGDAYALANVLQDLGVAYSRLGRLSEASGCLQEVVALRRSLGSAGALALALNNLGYYYHRGGDYRQAMATFQEGLSVVARVPNRRAESYLLWSMGDLQRDRGAFDEALRLYNKGLELLGNNEPSLRCAILISASILQRWQGNPQSSLALAHEALDLASTHSIALESASAQAAIWIAEAQMGDTEALLDHLEGILAELRQQGSRFELIWAFGLCAQAALLCADPHAAEGYLQSALNLAQEIGSAQPLVAEILHTPLLLNYLNNSPARYGTLLADLKHLREVQVAQYHGAKLEFRKILITYTLRVQTLGREQIERDGQIIPITDWRSNSAREMFLYLLFSGPRTREQISLAFWPDSEPKRVRNIFHTTLYRARQALGENVIMFQDPFYSINPEVDVWCDAHELEMLVNHASLMPSRDARTEDLFNRAVKLYHGDFLPSWDAEWITYRREGLLEAYLQSLVGLGECMRVRDNPREAITIFKRALDVDPYREDVHRLIMRCYAALGEKKQILAHLQRLQNLLWDDLGIEPSDETLALADNYLT